MAMNRLELNRNQAPKSDALLPGPMNLMIMLWTRSKCFCQAYAESSFDCCCLKLGSVGSCSICHTTDPPSLSINSESTSLDSKQFKTTILSVICAVFFAYLSKSIDGCVGWWSKSHFIDTKVW